MDMLTEIVTVDDLLDLLPVTAGRGWRVHRGGAVRDARGFCPVCALVDELCNHDTPKGEPPSWVARVDVWQAISELLPFPAKAEPAALLVAYLADEPIRRLSRGDAAQRRRMLHALGLG